MKKLVYFLMQMEDAQWQGLLCCLQKARLKMQQRFTVL